MSHLSISQCQGFTQKGCRCSNKVRNGTRCHFHKLISIKEEIISESHNIELPSDVWSYIIITLERGLGEGYSRIQKWLIPIFSLVSKFFNQTVCEYIKPIWCRSLEPKNNSYITDSTLKHLSKCITELDLYCNHYITDDGLSQLASLKTLKLWYNSTIAGYGITKLTNLETLVLTINTRITNASIYMLTNLKTLILTNNDNITDAGISKLINLRTLAYSPPYLLKDDGFYRSYVTDDSISRLTNLTKLEIGKAKFITDKSIIHLTNLTSLSIRNQNTVTLESLTRLKNLKELNCKNSGIYPLDLVKFDFLHKVASF
jgi:hypothetical protein